MTSDWKFAFASLSFLSTYGNLKIYVLKYFIDGDTANRQTTGKLYIHTVRDDCTQAGERFSSGKPPRY